MYKAQSKNLSINVVFGSMTLTKVKVSEWFCEILCSKAEKKVKIIEERYQKGENEETIMDDIRKLDEENDRLVASQCEMFEKKKLEPQM